MEYILLGVIQGLTEFLPVSSSGHLVIFQRLLNVPVSIPFDIAVHLATLLAVVIYFWKDLVGLTIGSIAGLYKIIRKESGIAEVFIKEDHFRLSILILISFFVTAVIGLIFSDFFESLFSSPKAAGYFMLLTAVVIFVAEMFPKGEKAAGKITILDSIVIGLAQAAAIAPGLSRSGTTISASLMRGLNRELAAKFSFLLSIPTILAAGVSEMKKITEVADVWPLILGAVAAFVSGYLAIHLFMRIMKTRSIRGFAYYCAAVGILVIILI